jgi:hypothetical protein
MLSSEKGIKRHRSASVRVSNSLLETKSVSVFTSGPALRIGLNLMEIAVTSEEARMPEAEAIRQHGRPSSAGSWVSLLATTMKTVTVRHGRGPTLECVAIAAFQSASSGGQGIKRCRALSRSLSGSRLREISTRLRSDGRGLVWFITPTADCNTPVANTWRAWRSTGSCPA